MIPEGLCRYETQTKQIMVYWHSHSLQINYLFRCGSLKKLILCGNRLITLPDAIHLLTDLEVLDLKDNPDLVSFATMWIYSTFTYCQ
jgi:hypothetical protein